MFGNGSNNTAAKESGMDRTTAALATTLAFAIAFVGTPQIAGLTKGWAVDYMITNYGAWTANIGGFIWFVIVALATFYFSKLALMTLTKIGQFKSLIESIRR